MSIPDHLVIYLSRNCNLACSYCYAGESGSTPIKEKDLLKAIIYFAGLKGRNKKVTFLGGEPLLHKALLLRAIKMTRRRMPGAAVTVFTNGTLLAAGLLGYLKEAEVRLVISLDGGRSGNDKGRRFRNSGSSVFDRVTRRLGADKSGFIAGLVVSPGTASGLAGNIGQLRRLGFESIAWAPDITTPWSVAELTELKRGLCRVKMDYLAGLKSGAAYEVANAYELLEGEVSGAGLKKCSNLVFGPDGFFYPCDKVLGAPEGELKKLRFSPDERGARRKFFKEAEAAGAVSSQLMCAVGPWAYARFKAGKAGPEMEKTLASQAALRKLVTDFYKDLFRAVIKYPAFRRAHGLR